MRAIAFRLVAAALAVATIPACATDRGAGAPATIPPALAAKPVPVAHAVVLNGTRALLVGEYAYRAVATVILERTRAGKIRGGDAERLQLLNARARDLIEKAKMARDAAARVVAADELIHVVADISAALGIKEPAL